jgi:hypothetical protein
VSRHWRMRWLTTASRTSAIPTKARSSLALSSPACLPPTALRSAWMVKGLGETTYSSSACSAASSTRKCTCDPTTASARPVPAVVASSTASATAGGRQLSLQTKHDRAYCGFANQLEVRMPHKAQNLVRTKSQAACLVALQHRKGSKAEIAILARLDLLKTAAALRVDAAGTSQTGPDESMAYDCVRENLSFRDRSGSTAAKQRCTRPWRPVPTRSFRSADARARDRGKIRGHPSKGAPACDQAAPQGHVTFGDPETPLWIVMRTGEKTPFLSRDEERVLSAIPPEYATNATKIRRAARMPENRVQQALEHLIASRFFKAFEGFQGNQLYRITAAGLKHPQRGQSSVARKRPAFLLNRTAFAKRFRPFWIRGRCGSETSRMS